MSHRSHFCLCLVALLMSGCGKSVAPVASSDPVIHPSTAVVGQGKHTKFEFYPRAANTKWEILSAPFSGYLSAHGIFYAPMTLPAERSITLQASNGGGTAQANVVLMPGPVMRADCFAPGQTDPGGPSGNYVYVEELPEAIVRVPPSYPDLAREAGVDGTVMLSALVCACGEVSEVRVAASVPMLDQAAIDAVRQWIFKPAVTAGEPIAVWVGIPVKFTLH